MTTWQVLSVEILIVAAAIIAAYELRTKFGWSLLFIFVGSIQYLQTVLASSLYLPLTPRHLVSPGSVVLFTSSLFAILLVFLRENIRQTRSLIVGVLLSNITLAILSQVTSLQLGLAGAQNFMDLPPEVFQVNVRHFLVGTATLGADAVLIVLIYEYLRTSWPRFPMALRLILTMVSVLSFDSLVFVTGAFLGDPEFWALLESNLVGKVFSGTIYGLVLFGYIRKVGVSAEGAPRSSLQELFLFLTYRRRYESVQRQLEDERQVSAKLRLDRDGAVAADQAKTSYLANISHEIRTPLNGIIGTIELLSESSLGDPKQRNLVRIMRSSSTLLSRLIDDVLDLAKIESGNFSLSSTELDLTQSLEDTVGLYVGQAKAKGIELTCAVAPELRGICWGDEIRFRQIVANLVSNAVKFTARGKVEVTLRKEGWKDGRRQVLLEVRDSGIGVAEKDRGKIFDVYQQAGRSSQRHSGGTGLGLAITKELVEAQGGTIELESELGKGTTFRVRLAYPIEPDELTTGTPIRVAVNVGARGPISVLAVDDDPVSRLIMESLLESLGVACRVVESPQEALKAFKDSPPDLVLTDLNLGEMDGIELVSRLRQLEGSAAIPMIAVTASALKSERQACLAAGLDDYLTKPLKRTRLADLLTARFPMSKIPTAAGENPLS